MDAQETEIKSVPIVQNECFHHIKSILGHLGLFMALILYTAAGAWVFQKLEYENDIERKVELKAKLDNASEIFTKTLLSLTPELHNFNDTLQEALKKLVGTLAKELDTSLKSSSFSLFVTGNISVEETSSWRDFTKSALFASQVLTTIGYGDMAPETALGRSFCILFAFIGIPFTLTVIAVVGKPMASAISESVKKCFPKQMTTAQTSKCQKIGTVAAAVTSFLLYITLGGYLFKMCEDWDYFESFYFCFITMTTIGLGDLVPESTNYMILCVYIMIGLALTSTAIEFVRIQYVDSMKQMRELLARLDTLADSLKKHGANINLDVILQDMKDLTKVLVMSSGKKGRERGINIWKMLCESVIDDVRNYKKDISTLKDVKKALAMSAGKKGQRGRQGSIWKFWESDDHFDDERNSNEPRLIRIIIYESSV